MKTYSFFLVIIFSLLVLSNLFAQESAKVGLSKTSSYFNEAELDSFIVAKMNQYHYPGLSACIIKDDTIFWQGNYGYANIAQNKLVTDSTLFYIASVSKVFTGTAIMQLWENGLFELDDDVNDYLPFSVRNPYHPDVPITFRMLLAHASSIHHERVTNVIWGSDSPVELGYYIENFLTYSWHWNNWAPGTKFEYCNVSVALLGYLVEMITDMPFEKYCQDSIFVPLGMNETSWFLANLDISKIATPYEYSAGQYKSNSHWGVAEYPATQIRTSLTQLARFLIAYRQGGQIDSVRILNSSTIDSMTTVQYPANNSYQGLMWEILEENIPDVGDKITCSKFGAFDFGANSIMGYILGAEEKVGCIVLTNRRYDDGIIEIWLELLSYGILKTTDIEKEMTNFPKNFYLSQNYPNPFNPSTTIEFTLPKSEIVELKIFNILGKEVSTLVSNKLNSGNYTYQFDGKNLASGIYYYQLIAGDFREVKKMILLR